MTKKKDIKVTAKIVLNVDIPVHGTWDPDCPVSQIHDQAVEAAQNYIAHLKTSIEKPADLHIKGIHSVKAIVVERT